MKNKDMWQKAAQNFIWDKPYKIISKASLGSAPQKWFIGGRLNYTKAIFEKNFNSGNASKEAVVFYKSPIQKESYTYASLLEEINSLAIYLKQKEIDKKSRVLILTDSKKEQIFSILALLRLGVQFGVIYSRFPQLFINTLIRESKATHIISNEKFAGIINIQNISLIKLKNINRNGNTLIIPRPVSSNFSSFLSFSSGTTGEKPKIFLTGTSNYSICGDYIIDNAFSGNLGNCHVLNTLDFAFGGFPMAAGLIYPLSRGGKIIFLDFEYRLNDKSVIKILEKECIETIISSPPFFEIPENKYKADKIKRVFLGGQKVSSPVSNLITKTFPNASIINIVGSQETSGYLINFSNKNNKLINTLKPLPGLEHKIINKEIFIKNTWPGLALQLNNKQSYSKRWHGKFFKTGDLVEETVLGLEVIGRTDKVIKHKGRQISLEYMENVLGSQPFVQKVRCLLVQNKPKLEIAVFLILKQNYKKHSLSQLKNLINSIIEVKFGNYAKSDKIFFIKEFPISASGKIMEKVLLDKYV